MEYVASRYLNYLDELQYRVYITDTLKARYQIDCRWYDLVHRKKPEPAKTAEEIKAELEEKHGIVFKEDAE